MDNGNESRMDRVERVLDRMGERLERLEERHEALTQTVEIVAGMQRDNEALHKKNETLLGQAIEAIHSLARIAEAHQQRLDQLEGQ